MAALNFPDNPNVNDVFTVGAREWIWDGSVWVSNSGRENTRRISANAPSDPIEGDEWYESNTGKLYIYFNDNWVQQLGFNPTKSIRSESANTALVSGDANQVIRFTGTSEQTLTVDDVLEVGDRVEVIQDNSGQVEFSSGSGVNLLSTTGEFGTSGQNAKVEIMCVAAGEYRLYGDLGALTLELEYLVIAGGGGGGSGSGGGGGGAGGYRSSVSGESSGGGASAESVFSFDLATNYTVTVGAGGSGAIDRDATATNGGNSIFATITSTGGGRGGNEKGDGSGDGAVGGSGGGSSYTRAGASGTTNQGFAGGDGASGGPSSYAGGGGGGASENALDGIGGAGGDGGAGISSSVTGSSVGRAGGGGGGSQDGGSPGTPGVGVDGGGTGAAYQGSSATDGLTNTGGGGGGGAANTRPGENGGSGIVILRYPSFYSINIGAGLTGSENTDGDFKYAEITAGTGNVSFS